MDRLVYQSHRIELTGESMRKRKSQQVMFNELTTNKMINLKYLNLNEINSLIMFFVFDENITAQFKPE